MNWVQGRSPRTKFVYIAHGYRALSNIYPTRLVSAAPRSLSITTIDQIPVSRDRCGDGCQFLRPILPRVCKRYLRELPLDWQRASRCRSWAVKSWLSNGWSQYLHVRYSVMGVVLKLSCPHFVKLRQNQALCFVAFHAHRFIELWCHRLCALVQMASQSGWILYSCYHGM